MKGRTSMKTLQYLGPDDSENLLEHGVRYDVDGHEMSSGKYSARVYLKGSDEMLCKLRFPAKRDFDRWFKK